MRTRRQIADGVDLSEVETEDAETVTVPFVRPTQASSLLLALSTEVLALQSGLAGYTKAKALYEARTELMLVCLALADAGRLFGSDEALTISIRSLEAFCAIVTAVGPDDASPMSVRMRIRTLSIGITSSPSTHHRHHSMMAASRAAFAVPRGSATC